MDAQETYDLYKQGTEAWNAWADALRQQRSELTKQEWNERAKTDFSLVAENCKSIEIDNFNFLEKELCITGASTEFIRIYCEQSSAIIISGVVTNLLDIQIYNADGVSTLISISDSKIEHLKISYMLVDRIDIEHCDIDLMSVFYSTVFDVFIVSQKSSLKNINFRECYLLCAIEFDEDCSSECLKIKDCTFHNGFGFHIGQFNLKQDLYLIGCKIDGICSAASLNVKGGCSFEGTTFSQVPDFRQAHFVEAPIMDGMSVPNDVPKDDADKKSAPSRYRALRRLASQAHDHMLEQDFLAGEIKAYRQNGDNWRKSRWWFGWIYQILSDFGRSPVLPMCWWVVLLSISHWAHLTRIFGVAGKITTTSCMMGGPETPWAATSAFFLSLKQGLISLGSNSQKMEAFYRCLYGDPTKIPASVIAWETVQMLLSGMLIYLFIKALSYQFRVK